MNRVERIKNVIGHKPVDYLPSHIAFSDRSRAGVIEQELGIDQGALGDYFGNHLLFTYSRFDLPTHFRNDVELMNEMEKRGFCKIDRVNNIVFDAWGMGIAQFTDGFLPVYFPLQGYDLDKGRGFMPDRLPADFLDLEYERALAAYTPPDVETPTAYDDIAAAVKVGAATDRFVVPAGYWGTFERGYGLRSFEEFMVDMAGEPRLVGVLLDKVTEFKMADARKKIEAGVQIGHHGDDLATQLMPLFSKAMFRDILLPRIKRVFDVYKSAGLPMAMHSCGNITDFIPDLIEIGLDLLEPVQPCMDLAFLKREYGADLAFWGGIDTQDLLPFGSPERVYEESCNVIRTLGKGGGYIIGPSQEVMRDVPIPNIVAMLKAIKDCRDRI